ncbi:hypothetical protein MKZ38_005520 [Zalerion maritima]|uniref:Uncharacterized protein n=1 Tax=Zalerion maritima TaxID=339359 RepID=A0AAD5WUS4_9PEZI|nr:hypothetical protein MKZ38_005520 [Zalerion maritima]
MFASLPWMMCYRAGFFRDSYQLLDTCASTVSQIYLGKITMLTGVWTLLYQAPEDIKVTLGGAANSHQGLGDHKTAEEFYRKCLVHVGEGEICVYIKQGKFGKALSLHEKTSISRSICQPGKTLLKLGQEEAGNEALNRVKQQRREVINSEEDAGFEPDEQDFDRIVSLWLLQSAERRSPDHPPASSKTASLLPKFFKNMRRFFYFRQQLSFRLVPSSDQVPGKFVWQ